MNRARNTVIVRGSYYMKALGTLLVITHETQRGDEVVSFPLLEI